MEVELLGDYEVSEDTLQKLAEFLTRPEIFEKIKEETA